MTFLANENFPAPSIAILRRAGFVVFSIKEVLPGASDVDVVKIAQSEGFIVLTMDKDYGEIVFRNMAEHPRSVILFRLSGAENPDRPGEVLVGLLNEEGLDVADRFTVVERGNVRQRILDFPVRSRLSTPGK